jgi:hypothetical protein
VDEPQGNTRGPRWWGWLTEHAVPIGVIVAVGSLLLTLLGVILTVVMMVRVFNDGDAQREWAKQESQISRDIQEAVQSSADAAARAAAVQDSLLRAEIATREASRRIADEEAAARERDRLNLLAACDGEIRFRLNALLDSLERMGMYPVSPRDILDRDQDRLRMVWNKFLGPRDRSSPGAAQLSTLELMENVNRRVQDEDVRLAVFYLQSITSREGEEVLFISSTDTVPDTVMLGFRDPTAPLNTLRPVKRSQQEVLRRLAIRRWVSPDSP